MWNKTVGHCEDHVCQILVASPLCTQCKTDSHGHITASPSHRAVGSHALPKGSPKTDPGVSNALSATEQMVCHWHQHFEQLGHNADLVLLPNNVLGKAIGLRQNECRKRKRLVISNVHPQTKMLQTAPSPEKKRNK